MSGAVDALRRLVADEYGCAMEEVTVTRVPIAYPSPKIGPELMGVILPLLEGWDDAHDDRELIANCQRHIDRLKKLVGYEALGAGS